MSFKLALAKGAVISAFGLVAASGANAITTLSWDFNNTLAENRGGVAAEYMYGEGTSIAPATLPGYQTQMIGGQAATVARFDQDGAFAITTNFAPNNVHLVNGQWVSCNDVNRYTIVADLKFDPAQWISFYQTATSNDNDGDMFFYQNSSTSYSAGISGNYNGSFNATGWNRIALVVNCNPTWNPSNGQFDLQTFDIYVNGTKISSGPNPWDANDGRWSLGSTVDPPAMFYMFASDEGDTSGGYINSLAVYNDCLTPAQIAALGGPTAAGIDPVPEPATLMALTLGALGILARRTKRS